jgi:hypothetical protein
MADVLPLADLLARGESPHVVEIDLKGSTIEAIEADQLRSQIQALLHTPGEFPADLGARRGMNGLHVFADG